MSATIIDGKAIAKSIREEVANRTQQLKEQGISPCLAVVLVGDNPASQVYVRNKERACINAGIDSRVIRMSGDSTQEAVEAQVRALNEDPAVHGILVQLPLPRHLCERTVLELIDPDKDVDGLHVVNAGRLASGMPGMVPCTPQGVIRLIESCGVEIAGKRAVMVGRSNLMGKPCAQLLLQKNATVTVCHSRTENLSEITRQADILVVAIGREEAIRGDMIKPGAVVIDVGVNRGADGKLRGDVHFAEASEVAGYLTPVPGGVGPMTIAMLLMNTLQAAGYHG